MNWITYAWARVATLIAALFIFLFILLYTVGYDAKSISMIYFYHAAAVVGIVFLVFAYIAKRQLEGATGKAFIWKRWTMCLNSFIGTFFLLAPIGWMDRHRSSPDCPSSSAIVVAQIACIVALVSTWILVIGAYLKRE